MPVGRSPAPVVGQTNLPQSVQQLLEEASRLIEQAVQLYGQGQYAAAIPLVEGTLAIIFTTGSEAQKSGYITTLSSTTLKEATVIDIIKRSLLAWQVPQSITGTIRLTLRLQS